MAQALRRSNSANNGHSGERPRSQVVAAEGLQENNRKICTSGDSGSRHEPECHDDEQMFAGKSSTKPLQASFEYWGKARPTEQGPDLHLLPYHCLDVAAVGLVYLKRNPAFLSWLCQRFDRRVAVLEDIRIGADPVGQNGQPGGPPGKLPANALKGYRVQRCCKSSSLCR